MNMIWNQSMRNSDSGWDFPPSTATTPEEAAAEQAERGVYAQSDQAIADQKNSVEYATIPAAKTATDNMQRYLAHARAEAEERAAIYKELDIAPVEQQAFLTRDAFSAWAIKNGFSAL
jgi:hypothetical protein